MMGKHIQHIKTFVLWLLFAIAIALVAMRSNDLVYSDNETVSTFVSQKYLQDMLLPNHIIVSFDSINKTQIMNRQGSFYGEAVSNLREAILEKKSFDEVSYDDFKSVSSAKRVTLTFNEFPGLYISYIAGINDSNIDSLESLSAIHYIIGQGRIFIETKDKIYELSSEYINTFPSVDELSTTKYQKYFPIFYPLNPNGNLLLPVNPDIYIQRLSSKNLLNEIGISEIAESIFKEKFDFTSSIVQKDGVYFYSYKNGEKILEINDSGRILYKDSSYPSTKTKYIDAAISLSVFLSDANIPSSAIKIERVYPLVENNVQKIRFELTGKHLGIGVVNSANKSVVDVCGSSVVFADLSMITAEDFVDDFFKFVDPRVALTQNLDTLKKILMVGDSTQLIRKIKDFTLVYYYDQEDMYTPCWSFDIGGYVFFFNGMTGELMHYAMV